MPFVLFESLRMPFGRIDLAPNSSVTHLLVSSTHWFQRRWEGLISNQFTILLIQAGVLLKDWLQEVLSEKVSLKDVNLWSQSCLSCQLSKIQTHLKSPTQQILVPGPRFSHIHIDLVWPLPQYCKYTFLFTLIEKTSRWPNANPLQSTKAEECVNVSLRKKSSGIDWFHHLPLVLLGLWSVPREDCATPESLFGSPLFLPFNSLLIFHHYSKTILISIY